MYTPYSINFEKCLDDKLTYTCVFLRYRIPWFQRPIIYDIRARPKLLTSPTGSKDLQMVNIGLRVLYRPDQHSLPTMYRLLGVDYDERVLPSICNEVKHPIVCLHHLFFNL